MEPGYYPKRMTEFMALALAFAASLVAGAGWWWASANRIQFASSSRWPMPGLFLIHKLDGRKNGIQTQKNT